MAHVKGHLRELFTDWVEGCRLGAYVGQLDDVVDDGGSPVPLVKLLGKLWRCTDIMPGDICEDLDLPRGSTYAQAVQSLMAAERLKVG